MSRLLAIATLFASLMAGAYAQDGKPVRFMVAFTPGGTADTIARVISQKIGEVRGIQSIVENRGGANGTIGLEAFRSWPADGTSYSVISNSRSRRRWSPPGSSGICRATSSTCFTSATRPR